MHYLQVGILPMLEVAGESSYWAINPPLMRFYKHTHEFTFAVKFRGLPFSIDQHILPVISCCAFANSFQVSCEIFMLVNSLFNAIMRLDVECRGNCISNKKAEVGQSPRLVRASNKAQALRHVADEFEVESASQESLVKFLSEGVKVEDARDAEA